MSTFGVLALIVFLVLTGGLAALESGGNSDLPMAKIMMFLLRLLVVAEVIIAIFEFPAYVADGIFFACMGAHWLAYVMIGICVAIVLFIAALILPHLNWDRHLTASYPKLIIIGLFMLALFTYNEMFNGAYSFDSMDEFRAVKAKYEEYDDHFFPTKYIKHYNKTDDMTQIALYPLDITTTEGHLPIIYKGETFERDGEIYFYPFTFKLYEGSEPLLMRTAPYSIVPEEPEKPPTTASDAASQTASASDGDKPADDPENAG